MFIGCIVSFRRVNIYGIDLNADLVEHAKTASAGQ